MVRGATTTLQQLLLLSSMTLLRPWAAAGPGGDTPPPGPRGPPPGPREPPPARAVAMALAEAAKDAVGTMAI